MRAWLRLCLLLLLTGMESQTQTPVVDALAALDKFSTAYNRFAATWARGTFDIRQAKQLSKLWRDVEDSGYWPREEKHK